MRRALVEAAERGLVPYPNTVFPDESSTLTVGWTGAEIEQCVVSAITQARIADREVNARDLITTAVRSVPLSRTMKEQINRIRSWAFERAVRASPLPLGR